MGCDRSKPNAQIPQVVVATKQLAPDVDWHVQFRHVFDACGDGYQYAKQLSLMVDRVTADVYAVSA